MALPIRLCFLRAWYSYIYQALGVFSIASRAIPKVMLWKLENYLLTGQLQVVVFMYTWTQHIYDYLNPSKKKLCTQFFCDSRIPGANMHIIYIPTLCLYRGMDRCALLSAKQCEFSAITQNIEWGSFSNFTKSPHLTPGQHFLWNVKCRYTVDKHWNFIIKKKMPKAQISNL